MLDGPQDPCSLGPTPLPNYSIRCGCRCCCEGTLKLELRFQISDKNWLFGGPGPSGDLPVGRSLQWAWPHQVNSHATSGKRDSKHEGCSKARRFSIVAFEGRGDPTTRGCISLSPTQFCFKPKTALKNKFTLKKTPQIKKDADVSSTIMTEHHSVTYRTGGVNMIWMSNTSGLWGLWLECVLHWDRNCFYRFIEIQFLDSTMCPFKVYNSGDLVSSQACVTITTINFRTLLSPQKETL